MPDDFDEDDLPPTSVHIVVELIGGPLDGDTIIIVAAGSYGPPQQLCYLNVKNKQACWLVYETEIVGDVTWPTQPTRRRYTFIGTWEMRKGKKVA